MSDIISPLLTSLVNYGYPIVCLIVLVGSLGIPLPASTIILAAGSLTGIDDGMSFPILIALTICASVTGDIILYTVGHRWGRILYKRHRDHHLIQRVDRLLGRWGGWSIFATRFVATPLASSMSITAGASDYSLPRYIALVVLGETIWSAGYVTVGRIFGSNWTSIQGYLSDASGLITLSILGLILLALALKRLHV